MPKNNVKAQEFLPCELLHFELAQGMKQLTRFKVRFEEKTRALETLSTALLSSPKEQLLAAGGDITSELLLEWNRDGKT